MEHMIFEQMAERWPAPIVSRTEVQMFTGGAISEKYLANLDSRNLGPEGRFHIGRKVVYPVHEFVKWLKQRSTPIPRKQRSAPLRIK